MRLLSISITSLGLIAFFQETVYLDWKMEHVINFSDKQSKGTHWLSLFIGRNAAVYFGSFGIEYILQELLSKIKDKSITHNICRI